MEKKSVMFAVILIAIFTLMFYSSSSHLVIQKGYRYSQTSHEFMSLSMPLPTVKPIANTTNEHKERTSPTLALTSIPTTQETTMKYSVVDEQKTRQETLQRSCSRLHLTRSIPQNDEEFLEFINRTKLFFSDKYKLIACQIPKVGCTNFKKVLLVAEGLVNNTNPKELSGHVTHDIANRVLQLKNLGDVTEIKRRLNNYYKVVMVRDPLHRVLSAYRNKFEAPDNKYYSKIAREIHLFLSKSNFLKEKSSYKLSFVEFVKYLNSGDDTYIDDPHWDHYYKLCSPCAIKYNFIAKLETVDDDMNYVMQTVGIQNITYPQNYPVSQRTTDEKVSKYFKGLSNITKNLISRYKNDYELFGYSLNNGKS
ncbi:carbohydrate sulfotransferase 9-like [Styela clava]